MGMNIFALALIGLGLMVAATLRTASNAPTNNLLTE
jgi:hypothetical protein